MPSGARAPVTGTRFGNDLSVLTSSPDSPQTRVLLLFHLRHRVDIQDIFADGKNCGYCSCYREN